MGSIEIQKQSCGGLNSKELKIKITFEMFILDDYIWHFVKQNANPMQY